MADQAINFTQLLDTFQLFDTNKDGAISSSELRAACQKLQMPINENKMSELFQTHDSISFEEFRRTMQDFGQYAHDAYFEQTFRAFDRNADGYITVKEIKKTMKDLGETLTDKQAKEMLKAADMNRDGKLSITEFRNLFTYVTQQSTTPPASPVPTTPSSGQKKAFGNPFKPRTE